MYSEQKKLKDLTAPEVLKAIDDSRYYPNEIEAATDELIDVRNSGHNKKISSLESRIEKLRKTSEDYKKFKSKFNSFLYDLNQIAKRQALLSDFKDALSRYVEIDENFYYHNNQNTYNILMSKIGRELHSEKIGLRKESGKITKAAYKLLKKNAKKYIVELTSLKYIVNRHDKYIVNNEKLSIDEFIDDKTMYNIENVLYSYYSEREAEYSVFYGEKILYDKHRYSNSYFAGQDFDLLKKANSDFYAAQRNKDGEFVKRNGKFLIKDNDLNSTIHGREAANNLKTIHNLMNIEIKGIKLFSKYNLEFSDLANLEKIYEQILALSREIAGLNLVLEAFKGSTLATDEIYQISVEVRNSQLNKLEKMYIDAEKLYNNIQEKMKVTKTIELLVEQLGWIKSEIKNCKDQNELNYLEQKKSKKEQQIMNYLMGHPEIDPKDYGYNFDDPKVQEETYTEEEKIEENDQEIKIENLKKLSDNNSSNRTYFYAKYHDRRRITGQFFSFIDFLRNLNRNEGVNVLIAIEETKVLILEDVYEEYKKLFPKNSWYDSNIFASYCIRSSKKDYFF